MVSSMTVTIQLSDEKAAALKASAAAEGLTMEGWLERMAEQQVNIASIAHLQKTDPAEWAKRFDGWVGSHDVNTPVLSEDAMSRDSIYTDRA